MTFTRHVTRDAGLGTRDFCVFGVRCRSGGSNDNGPKSAPIRGRFAGDPARRKTSIGSRVLSRTTQFENGRTEKAPVTWRSVRNWEKEDCHVVWSAWFEVGREPDRVRRGKSPVTQWIGPVIGDRSTHRLNSASSL